MKCSVCNRIIPDDSSFCSFCGCSVKKQESEKYRPQQFSENEDSIKKNVGYAVYGDDISLQPKKQEQDISQKTKSETNIDEIVNEKLEEKINKTPLEQLVTLTVALPALLNHKKDEDMNIVQNMYAYCESVTFTGFFVRANMLEIMAKEPALTQDVIIKIADNYIEAVIKEVISMIPETSEFFTDMFNERAALYDSIMINGIESPAIEIVELLTHIIHNELDKESYIKVDDRNFRYFGGIFENLTIKAELTYLFSNINNYTLVTIEEISLFLKNSCKKTSSKSERINPYKDMGYVKPVQQEEIKVQKEQPVAKENNQKTSSSKRPLVIFVCIIIIGIIALLIGTKSQERYEHSATVFDPTSSSEPESGAILEGAEGNGYMLTVTSNDDNPFVVKLKTESGETKLSFYVRAGETVTVAAPFERLFVYYACGPSWDGIENLFGNNTTYYMDKEACDFRTDGWEYELSDGKLDTGTTIDKSDF